MKTLLVINGPNLDMLGKRDKNIYGDTDYATLVEMIKNKCAEVGFEVEIFQSYVEGDIAKKIAHSESDALLINAGGYSHYSIAIRDAIELNTRLKTAVVHISDIEKREEFRRFDMLKDVADVYIKGHGVQGYIEAIDELKRML